MPDATGIKLNGKRRLLNGKLYELREMTIGRETTRNQARQLLADEAEYGRWELDRTRLYIGGERKVLLRRRIMQVERT